MADKKISDLLTDNPVTAAELTASMGLEIYDPDGATATLKSGGTLLSSLQAGLWRLYPEKKSIFIDGSGSAIATGVVGHRLIPWACTIVGVTALATTVSGDNSGSIVVDIWAESYANYSDTVPDNGDSICDNGSATTPVTITAGIKSEDTTLTNWTTTLAAGTVLRFNVDSCTDVKQLEIILHLRRTE
jgi:hypothetical protein